MKSKGCVNKMYYYMLKILDMYSAPYALIMITKITAMDKDSNNLVLSYISVDSYEYWATGTGIFSGTSPQWQTNRGDAFPHYLVFSSPNFIRNISITTSSQGYTPKDCEIYYSVANLSSYTDTGWHKLVSFAMPNSYTTTTVVLPLHYYLINCNNQYKYFNKSTFLMNNIGGTVTANDYKNYGNEDLSYLCNTCNQEVLQMTNPSALGSGKEFSIQYNNKFLDVNNVHINNVDQYTKLLIHMDDSTFKDECGHTVTNNGVVLNTTTKKFGNASAYFNGSNSYLDVSNNPDLEFGVNDFTIDCWMYAKSLPSSGYFKTIYSKRLGDAYAGGIGVFLTPSSTIVLYATSNNSSWDIFAGASIGTITLNTWYHIAVVRKGNYFYGFINGMNTYTSSAITSAIATNSYNVHIGTTGNGSFLDGYIDEFRISNIARWTSNFTPLNYQKYLIQDVVSNTIYTYNYSDNGDQNTVLCMHMDDGNFTDTKGNTVINNGVVLDTVTKKFGDGSASFNGTNNIQINQNSTLDLSKLTDFTIDFWFYQKGYIGQYDDLIIIGNQNDNLGQDVQFYINIGTIGLDFTMGAGVNSGYAIQTGYLPLPSLNIWHHIAFVKNNFNYYAFVDGNMIINLTSNKTITSTLGMIGFNMGNHFNGNIDELRISNIARWTSNFTPPTYNKALIAAPSQTIDEDNFKNNGISDWYLKNIDNSTWKSVFNDITNAKILYYTDDLLTTEVDLTCDVPEYRPIDELQDNFSIEMFKDDK